MKTRGPDQKPRKKRALKTDAEKAATKHAKRKIASAEELRSRRKFLGYTSNPNANPGLPIASEEAPADRSQDVETSDSVHEPSGAQPWTLTQLVGQVNELHFFNFSRSISSRVSK